MQCKDWVLSGLVSDIAVFVLKRDVKLQPSNQLARWLPTLKPSHLTRNASPPVGCYHPPSLFIIIAEPKNWYLFYRPTEGGRLSWPRHCSRSVQPVPKAVAVEVMINTWWDSNLGLLCSQSHHGQSCYYWTTVTCWVSTEQHWLVCKMVLFALLCSTW